jgi:glycosyltransferase involved in cell wall biosynthesis
VLLLALGLRSRGHEPLLVGAPDSPLVKRAQAEGLAVAAIPMIADWDLRAARRIRARMRAWRADVVHAHDARSHALGLLAVLGSRTPLVVTRRVAFPPKSAGLKYGERVNKFIAISNAVRDAMIGRGIASDRIQVIHSGVALPNPDVIARDWRSELGWPADSVIAGVIGAMTAEKGIDSLEAIAAALPVETRKKTRFLFLGGSRRGAAEIGGVTSHFAGFVDSIEPATAGIDILLHPSRTEGLGTSVIDAMALGIPPVTFNVGGLPEVVENNASGILVPAGDIAAFADAAGRLMEDVPLRRKLGDAARARSRQFGADRMTEQTEMVYQGVITG